MARSASPADIPQLAVSRDGFLDGRVNVSQPVSGFRSGLDTVLLAASVSDASASLLEMGAGAGVASCCLLSMHAHLTATLVDVQPAVLVLAEKNLAENGFAGRSTCIVADVTARGAVRAEAGMRSDHYSTVIANPPFFDARGGTMPGDAARASSRHMPVDDLDLWVKTAAACAAPEGEIIFVHTASALAELLTAFSTRFGNMRVLPIVPRPGAPASRVLVRGIKGSKAPLALLSPLVLHDAEGHQFQPAADAIFRGERRLDW